jgi:hypothetical protein
MPPLAFAQGWGILARWFRSVHYLGTLNAKAC